MTPTTAAIAAFERLPWPDAVSRLAIARLVGRTAARLGTHRDEEGDARFLREMAALPVAAHADLANAQHYELPPAFFAHMLGPRRKYSCCYYRTGTETLAEAEAEALRRTVANAALRDGQRILELGCGWGALSLFMAETFPHARIVAVSNAAPQRHFIEAEARARGLANLEVRTADMNVFQPDGLFDRIVSVEMFEHMANWRVLLARARGWLERDGRLFLHVFSHRTQSYRFDAADPADWIAQHFFTGGVMPGRHLAGAFPDLFTVEQEWSWSGMHYAWTARDWLARFDASDAAIAPLLREVYGHRARLWHRRWRLFLLATEGLFGHAGGDCWGVTHTLLAPAERPGAARD